MKISHLLNSSHIFWNLPATSKEAFFKEVAQKIQEVENLTKADTIAQRLWEREKLGSTAIGKGIAIPHCKWEGLKDCQIYVASTKQPIDFDAMDKKGVKLFFIVLSHPNQPSQHLQLLARISKLLHNPGSIENLMRAKSPQEFQEILVQEEQKIFG